MAKILLWFNILLMTDMPPAELHQPTAAEIGAFNRLVLPATLFTSRPEFAGELLREGPEADRLLYRSLFNRFEQGGPFTRLTAQKHFGQLAEYAETVATEVGTNYEFTVPQLFAVHAIASAMATNGRDLSDDAPRSDDRTTYFLTQLATRLAGEVSASTLEAAPDPHAFALAIAGRVGRVAQAVYEDVAWMQAKMHTLADRLLLRRHVLHMIDQENPVEVADLGALRRTNNELFRELRRLERYHLGPAIYEGANANWSIRDLFDMRLWQAAEAEAQGSNVRPDQWQPAMAMSAIEHDFADLVGVQISTSGELRPNYDAFKRYVFMSERGKLFGDMYGAMPLYPLYEQAGKAGNCEALRQFLMQQYFDLAMPAEVVAEAMQQTNQLLEGRNADEAREQGQVFHDLLLPRLRIARRFKCAEELDAVEDH